MEEASCSTGSDNLVAVLSRVRRWREVVKNGVRRLSGGDQRCLGRKNWSVVGMSNVSKNWLVMVVGGLTFDLRVVLAG